MNSFLAGAAIILLCVLVYQDFKFRAVSWLLLAALFIVSFAATSLSADIQLAFKYTVCNSAFILVQMTLVLLYFFMRNKTIRSFTSNIMGWGDILFFFAITPLFTLYFYVLFMIAGLIVALTVYFFLSLTVGLNIRAHPVPLAGIMAVLLIVLKLFKWCYPQLIFRFENAITTVF